jgi:hypothetical protein
MRDFDRDKFAMRAAITAALRAMEPELRAAVERMEIATRGCEVALTHYPDDLDIFRTERDAARRDLFARLGLDGDA